MASNSIENTIKLTFNAIKNGMNIPLIKSVLIEDGFKPDQAKSIIRWAQQLIKKSK